MRRPRESFAEALLKLPWWVSALLGLASFSLMRWGAAAWAGPDPTRQMFAKPVMQLAPVALALFGIFALGSIWFARARRKLVSRQASLDSLRQTGWKQFEVLVAEAYRRQGWRVRYSLARGADGGVDLILQREGRTALVQCKRWKERSVGVSVAREMFGLLAAEKADEAIIVTSGGFTNEARRFAEGKAIQLVDGPQLLALVQSVRTHGTSPAPFDPPAGGGSAAQAAAAPACPACGNSMLMRTARRGPPGAGRMRASAFGVALPIPIAKALLGCPQHTRPETHTLVEISVG